MISDGGRRPTRGMTILELLIALALAVLLGSALWTFFSSSLTRSGEAQEELALVQEAQTLFRRMSRDINGAYVFLPPFSGENLETTLSLWTFDRWDIPARLGTNLGSGGSREYPHARRSGEVASESKMLGTFVRYQYDPQKRTVSRSESPQCTLILRTSPENPYKYGRYSIQRSRPHGPFRVMARHVGRFEMAYVGYNRKGGMKLFESDQRHRASLLGLSYAAAMDEGLYATSASGNRSRRLPQVEVATKFWIMRKLKEREYPEYFSSIDDDLRY